jgi:hypothetical protein
MQTNYPSVKAIMQTGCSKATASVVKRVFTANRTELLDDFEAARRRTAECYNRPGLTDLRMTVIDDLLETHGVEGDENIEYCNAGDTYAPTICYYQGRFVVSSWGDIIERGC